MCINDSVYSKNLRSLIVCMHSISDTIQHCLHLKTVVENMWDGWLCGGCMHMANVCEENISVAIGQVKSSLILVLNFVLVDDCRKGKNTLV